MIRTGSEEYTEDDGCVDEVRRRGRVKFGDEMRQTGILIHETT
jgi:hypothetical protein